jgi:hypothetical protein
MPILKMQTYLSDKLILTFLAGICRLAILKSAFNSHFKKNSLYDLFQGKKFITQKGHFSNVSTKKLKKIETQQKSTFLK